MAKLDEKGHEILDDTPVALPFQFKRPPSIADLIRTQIRTLISAEAASQGEETFDEADDFDIGDEPELKSKYELDDEQVHYRHAPEPAKPADPVPAPEPAKPAPAEPQKPV